MKRVIILFLMVGIVITASCTNQPASTTLTSNSLSIAISPSAGSYITNSENKSSGILLKDVEINKNTSDEEYIYAAGIVGAGETILIITGNIQNKHEKYKEITMYAEGYDSAGKQVAWTLDSTFIMGQIGLLLESDETGQFTLHLNMANNVKSIRIFANSYSVNLS